MAIEVFKLTGSDAVTTQMASSYGKFSPDNLDMAVKIAQGNPGAMRYLIDMHQYFLDMNRNVCYDTLYFHLKDCDCLGSDFYVMFKERGSVRNTADILEEKGLLK